MKKILSGGESIKVLYKIQSLLTTAPNRYKITLQVAERAKIEEYGNSNTLETFKVKSVIKAIVEMAEEVDEYYARNLAKR